MSQTPTSQPSPGYEVHTPVFEGPLALLLRLIEKNELDITRLALAQVTDEFLAYVAELQNGPQIEVLAEFLSVAAKLLWIKSKALLPQPPAVEITEDEEDVGDELVRQLRAYRQYKVAAAWLHERSHTGLHTYVRLAALPRPRRITVDLGGLGIRDLHEAAHAVFFPAQPSSPAEVIQRPKITIADQIRRIRRQLQQWVRTTFQQLLSDRPTRLEAVVTLQAILELIKQEAVAAYQDRMFEDIRLEPLVPPEQIHIAGPTSSPATMSDPLSPQHPRGDNGAGES